MLCDVAKVFAHPLTECSVGVTNVLTITNIAGDAIDDVVGFAVAVPYSVISSACNRASDGSRSVVF